jgi:hypothetical protein
VFVPRNRRSRMYDRVRVSVRGTRVRIRGTRVRVRAFEPPLLGWFRVYNLKTQK